MKLLLCLLAVGTAACPLAAAAFSPAVYGAAFSATSNDAAALQRAIDAAYAAGGGTVVIPAGRTLMSGSFELKSNVILSLEAGSRLVASTLESDYPDSVLIRARHAENVAITGSGTIDGRGLEFLGKEGPYIFGKKDARDWRPRLILFEDSLVAPPRGLRRRRDPRYLDPQQPEGPELRRDRPRPLAQRADHGLLDRVRG
jgi:hypothetical protein